MAVKYVVTLMLENRSFDHMLGYSGITGSDAISGAPTAVEGVPDGVADAGPARYCLTVGPKHDFLDVRDQLATPSGFVDSYAKEIAAKGSPAGADPQDAMRCFRSAEQLPVLHQLAGEFVVFDHWFASMPGPTWPNRFFVHAASSGGLDHSPNARAMGLSYTFRAFSFEHGHVFQRLEQHGIPWTVLSGGLFPQCFGMKGMRDLYFTNRRSMDGIDGLLEDVAARDRAYVFIEPSYGDILNDTYKGGTSQHALDDVTRGEWLLKAVYEKLRAHEIWNDCALLVTWDEHGGFWDHVTPPAATPPGDRTPYGPNNKHGFTFDRYGVRVPALLISPRAQRNQVDHRVHDHSTVLAMLQELWPDLGGPFTRRDGKQVDEHSTPAGLLDNDPRDDCPQTLAEPRPTDCPPDDDRPFTDTREIFGLPPMRTHTAAAPDATPSETTAGFAHIAHLIDASAVQPEAQQQAAADYQASMESTGALASYLNDVQDRVAERLQSGQTERVQLQDGGPVSSEPPLVSG